MNDVLTIVVALLYAVCFGKALMQSNWDAIFGWFSATIWAITSIK